MKTDDIESILNENSSTDSGAFRLWAAVLLDAVLTLKGERFGSRELAESFIFDTGNVFFELTCVLMNIEPSLFRERMNREILSAHRIEAWRNRARLKVHVQNAC